MMGLMGSRRWSESSLSVITSSEVDGSGIEFKLFKFVQKVRTSYGAGSKLHLTCSCTVGYAVCVSFVETIA
jgi:hypothetical protein